MTSVGPDDEGPPKALGKVPKSSTVAEDFAAPPDWRMRDVFEVNNVNFEPPSQPQGLPVGNNEPPLLGHPVRGAGEPANAPSSLGFLWLTRIRWLFHARLQRPIKVVLRVDFVCLLGIDFVNVD